MKRHILPLLLALVIMLGMIPAGFAQDTEESAEQHSYEAPVFTGIETGRAYCSLPAFALSGAESVFAYEILSGRGLELAKNEETGEIMSDAVYYRQRDVENIYGVKWNNEWGENGDDVASADLRIAVNVGGANERCG